MIEVVVDELVVRGLSPGEAQDAAAALEARLSALARDGGVAALSAAFLRTPPVNAPAGKPVTLGEAVAGAVWGAVSGGGGR